MSTSGKSSAKMGSRSNEAFFVLILLFYTFSIVFAKFSDPLFSLDTFTSSDVYFNVQDIDSEIREIYNEELEQLKKEIDSSLAIKHNRMRRSDAVNAKYKSEPRLVCISNTDQPGCTDESDTISVPTTSITRRAAALHHQFVFFSASRLNAFNLTTGENDTVQYDQVDLSEPLVVTELGHWLIQQNQHVVATLETYRALYILVSDPNGGYSRIYNYYPELKQVKLRQRIKNYGTVQDAKFFFFNRQVYLVVALANREHSQTNCHIYKWAMAHFDVIHSFPVRGALSVDVMIISKEIYIAIGQQYNEAGNEEIGTAIVKMDKFHNVEDIQLLYTGSPGRVHFARMHHETLLIIAQRDITEVFQFRDYHFVYHQTLRKLKGENFQFISIQSPDGEPFLIVSTGSDIWSYGLAPSDKSSAMMFDGNPTLLFEGSQESKIMGLTLDVKKSSGKESPVSATRTEGILAVTIQSTVNGVVSYFIKLFFIAFHKVPAMGSSSQIGEDELTACFNKLREKIEENKPYVMELKELDKTILRRGADEVYDGKLISTEGVVFSGKGAEIDLLAVNPDVEHEDRTAYSPSQLHDAIKEARGNNIIMTETLKTSLKQGEEGTFEGIIHFKNITVKEVQTPTLTVRKLNDHGWEQLVNQSIRASKCETLEITGKWVVANNLDANDVGSEKISGTDISDIVKTETGDTKTQIVNGKVVFSGSAIFNDLTTSSSGKLNHMNISDIYFKNDSDEKPVLYGVKEAEIVVIDANSTITYVNMMDLEEWNESVLHTQCSNQSSNGTVTFYGEFQADRLHVEDVNGMNWDKFRNDALRDGQNQTIPGNPKFGQLQVHHLEVQKLDGVVVNDLLNTKYEQTVSSTIHAKDIVVHGNITTETINGLILRNNVVLGHENATIHSDINFYSIIVDEIEFSKKEAALINGIEMPFGGHSNKLVVFEMDPDLGGAHINHLTAKSAQFDVLNDVEVEALKEELLNGEGDNIVKKSYSHGFPVHNVTVTGKITTAEFHGHPVDEYLTVHAEHVNAEIHFQKNVNIQGDITFDHFATLNGIRIADWSQLVVDKDVGGHVYGVKTFEHSATVTEGINVKRINNVPVDDYVMLRDGPGEFHLKSLKFTETLEVFNITVHNTYTQKGTVNGIDLGDLDESTISKGGQCVVYDTFEFNDIEVDALIVANTFNGYDVNDIIEHCVLLNSNNTYIKADAVIQDTLICEDDVDIEYLNEIMPSYFEELAKRDEDEHITGMKTFFGHVQMDSDLNCEHHVISNVNLTALAQEYVSVTKPQTITGNWKIEHLEVEDLHFKSICRVDPDKDFVNTESSEPQEMDGSVKFKDAVVTIYDIKVMNTSSNGSSDFNITNNTEDDGLSLHSLKCRDVTWETPNNVSDSLNDFITFGVRASEEKQEIDGPITFTRPVKAGQLHTTSGINGIDLEEIRNDGVLKDEEYEHLELAGNYHIENLVIGPNGVIREINEFDTSSLNGVNLEELNKTVVRKNGGVPIRGSKTLETSIDVDHLFVEDINGCPISNIVDINSEDKIGLLHLESLSGVNDINFDDCNLFEWGTFFDSLVLSGPEYDDVIKGQWEFMDGLHVEDFNAEHVNDVHLESAVNNNATATQIIYGRKEFKNIYANGNIEAKDINDHKIEEIQPTVVRKNSDHVFKTPVHMEGPTTFKDGLEVGAINGHKIKEVPTTLQDHHKSIAVHENSSSEGLQLLTSVIHGLNDEIPRTAVWFDYYAKSLDIPLKSISVDVAGGYLTFLDYFHVKDNECGLPKGCVAPVTSKATYSQGKPLRLIKTECERTFNLPFGPNGNLEFTSQSVSYNASCHSTNDGGAHINITKGGENVSAKLLGHGPLSSIFAAKTFISNGAEYLLLSETVVIDNEEPVHSILLYALETTDGESSFNLIQTIETAGISPIDVKHLADSWFLVVGRSTVKAPRSSADPIDYEELSDRDQNSKSEIYLWTECTEASPCHHGHQFQLLRFVSTGSVVDVELISVTNSRGIEEVFVIFVHSGNTVDILKYDYDFNNFMPYQSINFGRSVIITSVTSFKVRNILYVLFSSIPDGILVYEYQCVEGFKLQLTVPAEEVREVESFYIKKEIFMVTTGSMQSFIAKAVIQGQNSL